MSLDITLSLSRLKATDLEVIRYEYTDVLNKLFELVLVVHSTNAALRATDVVGHAIEVALSGEPLVQRIHGIVRRLRQVTCEPAGISEYELYVVPPL